MKNKLNKYELPAMPLWVIKKLTEQKGAPANTNGAPSGFMLPGTRNSDLTSVAGLLRRSGLDAEGIFSNLKAMNAVANAPLDEHEVQGIANSVARNYPPDLRGDLQELPVSRIIASQISNTCRYVVEDGWRIFNGKSWLRDPNGVRVKEQIKVKIEALVQSVKLGSDPETAHEVKKFRTSNKVNAVMSLIVPDPLVRAEIDDFDKNVSLFNVRNGTYDFSIGKLRPHQAEDMLTKVANVDHVPEAGCPTFLKVLGQSLPDEHADFLLRYLGYALQGDPNEQVFAILHGAGANGKSTVINAVSYLLGDYVANVEPSTLIKQKSDRVRTDIARLHGVHLAVTSELATGEILDAPLVKRLTGNDLITARALYSSEFEFKPKFSLVMTTNALPVIDGADDALTRRIILIPFNNVVPEAERDSTLNRQLESEASGIFNLLLTGLQDYHDKGLAIPDDIKEERTRYAASSDMLASFLSDETVEDDAGTAKAADLYNRYRHWCGMSGLRCLSSPQFKRELIKKGYEAKRSSSGNAWVGVRLWRAQPVI